MFLILIKTTYYQITLEILLCITLPHQPNFTWHTFIKLFFFFIFYSTHSESTYFSFLTSEQIMRHEQTLIISINSLNHNQYQRVFHMGVLIIYKSRVIEFLICLIVHLSFSFSKYLMHEVFTCNRNFIVMMYVVCLYRGSSLYLWTRSLQRSNIEVYNNIIVIYFVFLVEILQLVNYNIIDLSTFIHFILDKNIWWLNEFFFF